MKTVTAVECDHIEAIDDAKRMIAEAHKPVATIVLCAECHNDVVVSRTFGSDILSVSVNIK